MSWNQSVCFLKNKLAWSGCGLVWQVRQVMAWSDEFGCGEVRFGRCGKASSGTLGSVAVR